MPIHSPTQVDSIKCQRIIYILLLESYQHGGLASGKGLGPEGQFLLELCHPNLEIFSLLGPVERKIRGNKEVPKDIDHAVPKEVATLFPHHHLVLKTTEYSLEQ